MSSEFRFCPVVIGYASLSSRQNQRQSDFELLRRYAQKMPIGIDLLAEEILPSSPNRPMWKEVLDLIESGQVRMLIVPSLKHIAGYDQKSLSRFLKVLRKHDVALASLREKIDSRLETSREIIACLKKNTCTPNVWTFLNE